MTSEQPVDFAISYAGPDEAIAGGVASRLRELGFGVFFAPDVRALLVGADGEALFERLFAEAKEVVVFISAAYRARDWPRLEWDVILERPDRFIAVRLDDTKILGLSSKLFYVPFDGSTFAEIANTCIERLLAFERQRGIRRPTEYDRILAAMRDKSRGALAEAYQLVKDERKRDPLGELPWPDCQPRYRLFHERWANFSVVKRRTAKIALPSNLSREQLRLQLEHAAVAQFNAFRPDAVMVLGYVERGGETGSEGSYSAGRIVLAPFGRWAKAQDGVAYNLPLDSFELSVDIQKAYFKKS